MRDPSYDPFDPFDGPGAERDLDRAMGGVDRPDAVLRYQVEIEATDCMVALSRHIEEAIRELRVAFLVDYRKLKGASHAD